MSLELSKLLNLCELNPPKYFFSVSTDKAANPVNIMGASKSLMEKLILSKKNNFRVSTARFANVAFSNGSLLDGFIYRLNKNNHCLSRRYQTFFCNSRTIGTNLFIGYLFRGYRKYFLS